MSVVNMLISLLIVMVTTFGTVYVSHRKIAEDTCLFLNKHREDILFLINELKKDINENNNNQ